MKHLRRYIAVFLAAVISAAILVFPSSSDNESGGYVLLPNKVVDIDASSISSSATVCTMNFDIPESGRLAFTAGARKLSAKSVYEIINSDDRTLLSGKASELAGKMFTVNKPGTYTLKITLRKGQYIRKFGYTFTTTASLDVTPEGWLYGYELTEDDISQINKAFSAFIWHDSIRFDIDRIDEATAIRWLYDPNGWICDPYNSEYGGRYQGAVIAEDVLKKFGGKRIHYVESVPCSDLGSIIYHLFGITAQHDTENENWYTYDGDYYFNGAVTSSKNSISCRSYRMLSDGRAVVTMQYTRYEDGEESGTVTDIYAIVSVHQKAGAKYVRLHAVYDDEPLFFTTVS